MISLANSELLPAGRTRVKRRGYITAPIYDRIPTDNYAGILKISLNYMVTVILTGGLLPIAIEPRIGVRKGAGDIDLKLRQIPQARRRSVVGAA